MNKVVLSLLLVQLTTVMSVASPMPMKDNSSYEQFRATQKAFESTDGTIRYIDSGTSEKVVVLLHGVPTSGWLYRKMIDSLVAGGLRVIVPDMLGYGSSDSPKGYDVYNPDQHAKRLIELMDSLDIETWCHVFHDVGGLVTWELFKQAPNRVNSLVILNSIIYEEGFVPPIRFKRGPFAKIAMSLYRSRLTNKTMMKKLFKLGLMEDTELSKEELKGYQTPLLEGRTRGMYNFFTSTCVDLPNHSVVIKEIDQPTLVIWGGHDEMLQWQPQGQQIMEDLNIEADNVFIINSKHFLQEEEPQFICDHILELIEKR